MRIEEMDRCMKRRGRSNKEEEMGREEGMCQNRREEWRREEKKRKKVN